MVLRNMLAEQLLYWGAGTLQQKLDRAYQGFVGWCRANKISHSQAPFTVKMALWQKDQHINNKGDAIIFPQPSACEFCSLSKLPTSCMEEFLGWPGPGSQKIWRHLAHCEGLDWQIDLRVACRHPHGSICWCGSKLWLWSLCLGESFDDAFRHYQGSVFFPRFVQMQLFFQKGKKGNQSSSCNTGRSLFLRPTLICVDDKYHQHLRPHSQWAPFPWTAVPLPDLMLSTKDIHGQILPHDGVEPQELESRLILVERIIANTCGYLMCPC